MRKMINWLEKVYLWSELACLESIGSISWGPGPGTKPIFTKEKVVKELIWLDGFEKLKAK